MGEKAAIKKAFAALEKRFGEPVARRMGDAPLDIETISSGRPDLDVALGGGYGVGKIVEIFAEEACGKTGLALEAIKQVQDMGGTAAIVDTEHALNREYCEQIGVHWEDLIISQPDYAEMAIEVIRHLIESGEVDLIIVDSVAAMIPKSELEGESGEVKMGLQARLMSQALRQITGASAHNDCTIIFLNQMRSTIAMYGPSTTTTGGKALKFYASQRLEIKRKGWIKEGEEIIGFHQLVKIVKNKIAPPFKEVMNDIIYGKGVDTITGLVEACVFEGVLTKKGSFYYFGETRLAQGIKKLRQVFEDQPEIVESLQEELARKKE